MLKKIILLLLVVLLNSCAKEENISNEQMSQPEVLSSGVFEPTSGINVMGGVTIYKNKQSSDFAYGYLDSISF